MQAFRWSMIGGLLVLIVGCVWTGVQWYRSTATLKLAVAPGGESTRQFLQSLANHRGKVSIELVHVSDNRAALDALRTGKAQLASVRVDEDASGDIRAVAVLSGRYLLTAEGTLKPDIDLTHASERLAHVVARHVNVAGVDMRAARRMESPPEWLITRTSLKLTEEQADKLWYLGAAKDEPEEADDWRGRALLLSRMIVTSEKVDRQVIHDVAMAVTDVVRITRAELPAAREVSLAPIDEGKSILRAHDGVARFVNREGQGFFERYGDLVYVGMSVLGIVLTAIGGLFAWLRYRMADNGRRHLSRMRLLVRWAATRGDQSERVQRLAAKVGVMLAGEVAKRKIAYDVLSAFEVLQRTLSLVIEARSGK